MLLPEQLSDMPNGVLICLDKEGNWQMSVNRVVQHVMDHETHHQLVLEAKSFLREAQDHGVETSCGPEDDDEILEKLPKIGDSVQSLQQINRTLEGGLDEAASILPHLWEWLVGLADEPWEPND